MGQEVEARIVKIDRPERRIGLSIKAAAIPDEEFTRKQDEIVEGLRPGEDMVDLAGAFDQAMGEEWRPGETSGDEQADES
jgi:small subunit ribosomal protein S1